MNNKNSKLVIQIQLDENLNKSLWDFLKDLKKIAIMGIGNELKGDDGLGPYIINSLKTELKNGMLDKKEKENVFLIDAGTVPENFTGEIKNINPSHILIIDAAFMNEKPGTIQIIKKEEIANINISTHSMSLSYLIKYLEDKNDFKINFVGIEPLSMELGHDLSKTILKSSIILKNIILENLIKHSKY